MSHTPTVRRADQGPVRILTLDRPERRNALSHALVAALDAELEQASVDTTVRAVVLTGAGPTFCAGMDLKEADEVFSVGIEVERRAVADSQAIADLIDRLHRLPKPTVAAVQGDALAGGAGLALACDFVIVAAEARIGYPEVRRGLVASIVLGDLVRQVGDRKARALLLSGAPLHAADAERWGLINAVAPAGQVLPEALAVARGLCECGPEALATTKALLDEATDRPSNLRGAAAVTASIRVSDEAREGILAFLQKRPPRWCPAPEAIGEPVSAQPRRESEQP